LKQLSLGEKIKYFRKLKGLSQLELEMELNTTPGRLSRIENGLVVPTRATVLKIANVLKLTHYHSDYLDGVNSQPVSQAEVYVAVTSSTKFFSRPGYLAYLIDDRWKVYAGSDSFIEMLGIDASQAGNIAGKTIIEIMLNPNLGITKLLDQDDYENLIFFQLSRFYKEAAFIIDDLEIVTTTEIIKRHNIAGKIWEQIIKTGGLEYPVIETRIVKFNINGQKINFTYNDERLLGNRRFELIEYIPIL
jgi:transcriptional regulator with XRE-family HTH domain